MKMGRWIVVLFLVVVGAGCRGKVTAESSETESISKAAAAIECAVDKVERWAPSGGKDNPKLGVKAGQTVFVFGKPKDVRAKIKSSQAGQRVVPLNELRDGTETLWYGIAPKECWSKYINTDGIQITCVKCSNNIQADYQLNEPCCL